MPNYIVTNADGLLVHSKLDTASAVIRKMSNGEGFVVYQVYPSVKGVSGLQTWGRLTDNPGDVQQEYACLAIGNKTFAKEQSESGSTENFLNWASEIDEWARRLGFRGVKPF